MMTIRKRKLSHSFYVLTGKGGCFEKADFQKEDRMLFAGSMTISIFLAFISELLTCVPSIRKITKMVVLDWKVVVGSGRRASVRTKYT